MGRPGTCTLPSCRELYLVRHIEILLRDPSRVVGRQHAGDLGVPNIDIGMMLRRFRRFGDTRHKGNAIRKGLELKRFGKHITLSSPAWKRPKPPLNCDVR